MITISIDRIEPYLKEKTSIVDAIEAKLYPLFGGLMTELESAARALVGPPVSDDWYSKMMEVLGALAPGSSLYGYDHNSLVPMQDILNVYATDAGIRLSNTCMLESGMDQDEVCFSFKCDPWRQLFCNELASAHDLHTGAFIWVAQPNDDKVGVFLKELYHFELADLRVIRDAFDAYWNGALLWGKMRRSHLE